jgi:membrane-bound ClpP family serine protease
MINLQDPILINSNLVYVILMAGLWLSATGTYIPGTGIVEISGGLLLVGGLVAMSLMPTNWIAVIVLVLGASVFFLLPLLKPQLMRIAEVGLLVQGIASLFLFTGEAVSPVLVAIMVLLAWLYHHNVLAPLLKEQHQLSFTQKEAFLVGRRGRVVAPVDPKGTVQVKGELWTARSHSRLESGTEVVVIEQNGLELEVEKAKRDQSFSEE